MVDSLRFFKNVESACDFFGLMPSTIESKASTTHRVRDRKKNLWLIFSRHKDYKYKNSVIKQTKDEY